MGRSWRSLLGNILIRKNKRIINLNIKFHNYSLIEYVLFALKQNEPKVQDWKLSLKMKSTL